MSAETPFAGLVIFDVDGTLTDTSDVDTECFVAAFQDAFGIDRIDDDWSRYAHATDSWITREILAGSFGRVPSPEEVARVRSAFVERLHRAHEEAPQRFQAVAGARATWGRLQDVGSRWHVALASGGWRASAGFKLEAAGFDTQGVAAAFADDALTRREILALARSRAMATASIGLSRVVFVGDAVWDVRTCAEQCIPFVGIAREARADRLREAGARIVLEDLLDPGAVGSALLGARPPQRARSSRG